MEKKNTHWPTFIKSGIIQAKLDYLTIEVCCDTFTTVFPSLINLSQYTSL